MKKNCDHTWKIKHGTMYGFGFLQCTKCHVRATQEGNKISISSYQLNLIKSKP